MATATHIPVSEYLSTVYRPDCDYVDGEVVERNLGEQLHSLLQGAITRIFGSNRRAWGMRALPEQRVQLAPKRFRVPDVCVVASTEPLQPILTKAPLLCVEILSPEDRFSRILERVRDYQSMGVPHIWIIDPETRAVWTADAQGGPQSLDGDTLSLPGTLARMTVAEIFEEIDEAPKA